MNDKKTLVVNLSEEQEEILRNFADINNMTKTDAIRLYINMLKGILPDSAGIAILDRNNMKIASCADKFSIFDCKDINVNRATLHIEYAINREVTATIETIGSKNML